MSEGPLFEVELYAFEGTSGSFRLTPHEFDVEIGGERYERCPSSAARSRSAPKRPSQRWS
ncbi:hypothetical protein LJB71_12105 [Thermomonas sp. S9]|uniref:hypothetical protein n=1 Tax=Thermomonas sp. S9 TaxID=2885203 RepID=UPI00216B2B0C|nr:hypothetical protein [Thermomonas sp. S9]MCR6496886.1 hypothetical protein [Thermomonas sp. S9]